MAIGEVEERCTTDGEQEIHVSQESYFSGLTGAEAFAGLVEVEIRRRKIVQAKQVCAVTDGAHWLQGFLVLHRIRVMRILDFPYAAEHFSNLLQGSRR